MTILPDDHEAVAAHAVACFDGLLALLLPGTARAAPGACPNSDAPCPNIVTILADDLVRAAVHCLRRGPNHGNVLYSFAKTRLYKQNEW